ncbi:MAG: undecaprenyl/decaprenyl-phosphate alpha-N-acetylglucosaminyl 1-phosphate transferase, partial [Planctomycetes bacterium]|nr:undecaprenyl/decaprenyl-phosphate alpha-N-acetylglucosaminyl 1-phosphate transferase [Planctomycetota bacterium]
LASTVGLVTATMMAIIAISSGNYHVAVVAVALAAALAGFLFYNLPPASIFLGDSGSMLIGLMVGALAISGAFKSAGTVLLAAPLTLWTIPILDCGTAILRRKLTGRSVFVVDRGHLHHRMLDRLGSSAKVVTWVAVACAATCAAGLVSVFLKNDLIALLTCTAVVTVLIVGNVFGRMEAMLLFARLRSVGVSLVTPASRNGDTHTKVATRLQGSGAWDQFWETVVQAAEAIDLDEVKLDVHLPAAGESFSASMRPRCRDMAECRWRLHVPLLAGGQVVGQLLLVGPCLLESTGTDIERALPIVEQVQEKVPILCGLEEVALPLERDAELVDASVE